MKFQYLIMVDLLRRGKKIGWKDGFRAIWEIIKFNLFDGKEDK